MSSSTTSSRDPSAVGGMALPADAARQVVWFVALCLALAAASAALIPVAPQLVPFLLAMGPAVIALAIAWRAGHGSLRNLIRLLWRRPNRARWYLVLALPIGLALATLAVGVAMGAVASDPFRDAFPAALIVPLVVLVPAFAEELAWRGFAVARLMTVMSPLRASLVLAVPWVVMHLVLMLPGGMNEGAELWPTIVSLVAYSVVMTWVFVGTGGSVLVCSLLHAGLNGVVPLMSGMDPDASWVVRAILVGIVAIAVVGLGGFWSARGIETSAGPAPEPA